MPFIMLEINNPALQPKVFQRSMESAHDAPWWIPNDCLDGWLHHLNQLLWSIVGFIAPQKKHIEESNPQTVGKWRFHPFSDGSSYTKKKWHRKRRRRHARHVPFWLGAHVHALQQGFTHGREDVAQSNHLGINGHGGHGGHLGGPFSEFYRSRKMGEYGWIWLKILKYCIFD